MENQNSNAWKTIRPTFTERGKTTSRKPLKQSTLPRPLPSARGQVFDDGPAPETQVKQLTPMKQFDVAVTAELNRLKDDEGVHVNPVVASNIASLSESTHIVVGKSPTRAARNRQPEARVPTLIEAVERLGRAEAACRFDGAVRAAETAADAAPPELAEEAACAGARGYQTQLVDVVQERLPGLRPIEVLGYIGITAPH